MMQPRKLVVLALAASALVLASRIRAGDRPPATQGTDPDVEGLGQMLKVGFSDGPVPQDVYRREYDRVSLTTTNPVQLDYTQGVAAGDANFSKVYLDAAAALTTANRSTAAYLGVGVEPPGDALRSQLSLPDGAGLLVNYVDENGPSPQLIRQHDVLRKLDDQILINEPQLVALVRMHKPDETVTLTLVRQAKTVTVEVKLGQREVPGRQADVNWVESVTPVLGDIPYLNRLYTITTTQPAESKKPALGALSERMRTGPVTFNDGEVLARLGPQGDLLALDLKSGQILYSGKVETEDQWKAVPEQVRSRIESWRAELASPQPKSPQR